MKYRQIMNLLGISTVICVMLRVIQIMFTLDETTGFIKQEYSKISILITFVVCAAAVSVGAIASNITSIKKQEKAVKPSVAITGLLTGGMFFYEIATSTSVFGAGRIKGLILIALALASAAVFIGFGVKHIYDFKFASILLIVPTVYYIAKLINLFVSTSTLALVTKNVFMLLANAALLLFMFEFASYENKFKGKEQKPKRIFAIGIGTIMICISTGLPVIITAILKQKQLTAVSEGDVATSVLMITQAIFIFSYINGMFREKSEKSQPESKHSA